MNVPLLGSVVDERFLMHRLRSSSLAGMAGAVAAGGLFFYRYYVQHRFDWGLFAVIAVTAVIKVGAFVWYRLAD